MISEEQRNRELINRLAIGVGYDNLPRRDKTTGSKQKTKSQGQSQRDLARKAEQERLKAVAQHEYDRFQMIKTIAKARHRKEEFRKEVAKKQGDNQ